MSDGPLRAEKTLRQTGHTTAGAAPYTLIATLGDDVRSLSIGAERTRYTIGREDDVDLVLPDAAVSRHHLELRFDGTASIEVEDLASSNGTLLNGEPLPPNTPSPLRPGDQLQLGGWLLLLQAPFRKGTGAMAWPHGFFQARVEEELDRLGPKRQAAFIRLDVSDFGADPARRSLAELLPKDALVGEYGPDDLEVFVPGLDAEQTRAWLQTVAAHFDAKGARPAFGVSIYPKDGATAGELLSEAAAALRGDGDGPTSRQPVVADPRMVNLYALIDRVAKSQISVILSGETGVGKEVVAETMHRRSRRADGPFIRVNCAALNENLLESELFGHEKGAFTGALAKKVGLIEAADGGTLFLDEVGEMVPTAQVKLLRVLEERRVTRVGGVTSYPVDVRFVSATHRDLPARVESGDFREDLFFRLSGIVLEVPPLRERIAEIGPLTEVFIDTYAKRDGVTRPRLSAAALAHLESYEWPGNIRELRNAVERAVILCTTGVVQPDDLPLDRRRTRPIVAEPTPPATERRSTKRADPSEPDAGSSLADDIQALEKNRILNALKQTGGNQSSAAEVLGISRRTLMKRMDQFNIPRPRKG